MNLKNLTRVQDVALSNVTKLVGDFLKKNRTVDKATYPFDVAGLFGEVQKNGPDCTFTFYKADGKDLKPALTTTVSLPKGGTTEEITLPVAQEIEPILSKHQIKHPTNLELLKQKLGELTLAGVGNAAVNAVKSGVSAVNNLQVTKY